MEPALRPMEWIHQRWVYDRRVRVLADVLAPLLSRDARVLDVGCGDGRVAAALRERRPDVAVQGLDVLVRPGTRIPVREFDGSRIPEDARSFDDVLFVDVLHHADDPAALLAEGRRVARAAVVIKDHLRDGLLAGPTLRLMDRVGNERHGVRLPYHYWSRAQWTAEFRAQALEARGFRDRLPLYPGPADWIFGRRLHFAARLEIPTR